MDVVNLAMILLSSAAHYKDWGSNFMFDMDILEIRISSLIQQTRQTSTGLLLLMKLGAFNSCLQVPNTVQTLSPQMLLNQQRLLPQAFAPEQPQPPCSYGDGGFPPTLPIRTLPVEVLKISGTIFLVVSSLFVVIIILWSLKLIISVTSYFKRMKRVTRVINFLAILSLSLFVLSVFVILLATRRLLTRRTFYNHIALNVAIEPGGGFYILILVLITQAFLTIGLMGRRRRSNKVVSMEESVLPPPRP